MHARRLVIAGLVASVVMGMIEMIYEALAGAGFWSPLVYIGATVLRRLQTVTSPVPFDFGGVVLGLAGHMMNSVVLALVFGAIVSRGARSRATPAVLGAIYGLGVFVVMWFVVLPLIDPVMRNLNAPVFALAHIMWGVILGLYVPVPSGAAVGPAAVP